MNTPRTGDRRSLEDPYDDAAKKNICQVGIRNRSAAKLLVKKGESPTWLNFCITRSCPGVQLPMHRRLNFYESAPVLETMRRRLHFSRSAPVPANFNQAASNFFNSPPLSKFIFDTYRRRLFVL